MSEACQKNSTSMFARKKNTAWFHSSIKRHLYIKNNEYFFDRVEAEKTSDLPLGVTLESTFVLGTFWWPSGAWPFLFTKSEDPMLSLKIKLMYFALRFSYLFLF